MYLLRPLLGVAVIYQQVQLVFPSANAVPWLFVCGAETRPPFKETKTKVVFDVWYRSGLGFLFSPQTGMRAETLFGAPRQQLTAPEWAGDYSLPLWVRCSGQCVTYWGKHTFSPSYQWQIVPQPRRFTQVKSQVTHPQLSGTEILRRRSKSLRSRWRVIGPCLNSL